MFSRFEPPGVPIIVVPMLLEILSISRDGTSG
jgi:hypothetical protein